MRPINEIIVHCSATRPDWMRGHTAGAKVAEIKRWHVDGRGWSDIGYHYVIDRDGRIEKARPVEKAGAHTRGRNKGTIGVCLIGGHGSSETDAFSENFTSMQDKALRGLLADIQARHPVKKISGHNEYAAKACPGFDVSKWLALEQSQPPARPSPIAAIVKAIFLQFTKARK